AKPATLARGAAGVGAAAAGAAALGVIVAATPLGVLGMAAFLLAALGRVARMPRLSALAAAAAASTLLNYAVPVLFANSLVTVSALGFTALVPLGAMAAGVLGTAFVAVALTALRPEEAGAVAGRVVTRSAPLALVFSLAGAAGLLMGAPVLPLAGLAAAAYLFYRMPQLGPWKTLALSLPLIALGAGAEYLGAGAVFALALLWHEVLRPDGDAAGKGVLGVTV
ncbi:MAG: hypothetical protein SF051_08200, partial [Elusimicrobiota bacterium]|nr:hypothetical protein [Elusimicrobiota bacterium]